MASLAVVVVPWKRPPGLDALQIQMLHHCLKRKTNTSSQLTESNVSLIKRLSPLSNCSSVVQSLTGNKKNSFSTQLFSAKLCQDMISCSCSNCNAFKIDDFIIFIIVSQWKINLSHYVKFTMQLHVPLVRQRVLQR